MRLFTVISLLFTLILSGCASISRGIAEAVLEKSKQEVDKGECIVISSGFTGIETTMKTHNNKIKVMMVHGIGEKLPGYSISLVNTLALKLGLDVRGKEYVNIKLKSSTLPNKDVGNLRVYHLASSVDDRELTFYEYTWSSITNELKQFLNYDSNDTNASKRTELSKLMKGFVNETGTDALIYLGNKDVSHQIAFGMTQAACFMTSYNWKDLPRNQETCNVIAQFQRPLGSDIVFITHSLGSQIAIDLMQFIVSQSSNEADVFESTKDSEIKLFMFANQLPAISLGKNKPLVTGQIKNYCSPSGNRYKNRFFKKLDIIAFSDPNDILSYAIPSNFEDTNLDSRLCPETSNILVNVAPISNILGQNIANPLSAHSNYQNDERVLKLLIEGINDGNAAKNSKEGCMYIKLQ